MLQYIICFLVGFFTGMVITRIVDILTFKEARNDKKSFYDLAMSKESMRWFVGIIIAMVFVSAVYAEMTDKSYQVNLALYGLMGTVVGYLFFYKKDDGKKQ